MHIVLVVVTIRPEMRTEFEQALLHNARQSVAIDEGCRRFDVSQDVNDPTRWILHEVYDAPEAHAKHGSPRTFSPTTPSRSTPSSRRRCFAVLVGTFREMGGKSEGPRADNIPVKGRRHHEAGMRVVWIRSVAAEASARRRVEIQGHMGLRREGPLVSPKLCLIMNHTRF
jgi:quinol monooxygenase YgiN